MSCTAVWRERRRLLDRAEREGNEMLRDEGRAMPIGYLRWSLSWHDAEVRGCKIATRQPGPCTCSDCSLDAEPTTEFSFDPNDPHVRLLTKCSCEECAR